MSSTSRSTGGPSATSSGFCPAAIRRARTKAIVIGAHYDHVGLGGRHSAAPERTGEIHNGADDNASGTAAIIEMAREAVRSRARFPRTLVFIAFAGRGNGAARLGALREKSAHADRGHHRHVEPGHGRARSRRQWTSAASRRRRRSKATCRAAIEAAGKLTIRRQGPGAGRSDDSSFIAKGVPAINFFTGFHSDYHRPTDDWEKIDARWGSAGCCAGARVCRADRGTRAARRVRGAAVSDIGRGWRRPKLRLPLSKLRRMLVQATIPNGSNGTRPADVQ